MVSHPREEEWAWEGGVVCVGLWVCVGVCVCVGGVGYNTSTLPDMVPVINVK